MAFFVYYFCFISCFISCLSCPVRYVTVAAGATGKILFVVPTEPLVWQVAALFNKLLRGQVRTRTQPHQESAEETKTLVLCEHRLWDGSSSFQPLAVLHKSSKTPHENILSILCALDKH